MISTAKLRWWESGIESMFRFYTSGNLCVNRWLEIQLLVPATIEWTDHTELKLSTWLWKHSLKIMVPCWPFSFDDYKEHTHPHTSLEGNEYCTSSIFLLLYLISGKQGTIHIDPMVLACAFNIFGVRTSNAAHELVGYSILFHQSYSDKLCASSFTELQGRFIKETEGVAMTDWDELQPSS